jgi:hypothetical protein
MHVSAQAQATASATPSPASSPSALPEDPKVTALVGRWIEHLQSEPPENLRPLNSNDGPLLVVAARVLAGQGDPISITYSGATPPDDHLLYYLYLYKVKFQHSSVSVMLFIDASGNVHQIMFTSDHPFQL